MTLALAVLVAAPALLPAPAPCAPQKHRPKKKAIEAAEDYLERCGFFGWSGVACVSIGDDIVLHRTFGSADRGAAVDVAEDTLFEIASVSKTVTACAILALVEDGKLELDTPITEVLPNVPEGCDKIEIEHLLRHTSGVPSDAVGGNGADLAAAVDAYLPDEPDHRPGKAYAYWNGGYALLAGIVDTVAEEGYVGYCRKRLFEPIGLESTGFTGDETWPVGRQACGYVGGVPERRALGHPYMDDDGDRNYGYQYRGMGGVVTTAEDLVRFGRALFFGDLLAQSSLDAMLEPGPGDYCLGLRHGRTPRRTDLFSHGGDVRGFHTELQVLPKEEAVLVVTSSVEEAPLSQIAGNLRALLYRGDTAGEALPELHDCEAKDFAGLAGRYGAGALALRIEAVKGGVRARGEDLEGFLFCLGGWPREEAKVHLREANDALVALARGDGEPLGGILAPGIPDGWPARMASEVYPERAEGLGDLVEVVPTGLTQRETTGDLTERETITSFTLRHAQGDVHVRATFDASGLLRLELDVPGGDAARGFAAVTKRRKGRDARAFTGHEWTSYGRPAPRLVFDPASGPVRRLRIEYGDGSEVVLERLD